MRDDLAGPARPAGLCHNDRRVQGVLCGRAAPPVGRPRPGAPRHIAAGAGDRQGVELARQPPAGLGTVGRGRLDARNDGHHTKPGPQRPDSRGPCKGELGRSVRVGLLQEVCAAVRQGRLWGRRLEIRGRTRRGKEAHRRQGRRRPGCGDAPGHRLKVQGHLQKAYGQGVSCQPGCAAEDGGPGRVWQLDGRAGRRVQGERGDHAGHRRRDGRQRSGNGVRQHGQHERDRRRIHARPGRRLKAAVRRVPCKRAGRGCRGRHAHAKADRPAARRAACHRRRAEARVRPAREALPRAAGHRVYSRARKVLPAADAGRKDKRRRNGKVLGRHGPRGADNKGAGPAPPKARQARAATASHTGPKGGAGSEARGAGDRRLAGGRLWHCRVRHGQGGKDGRRGKGRDTRARRDKARGRARVLQVRRHTDKQGRQVIARGSRGPRHGQAVHCGHVRHAHRLCRGAVHRARRRRHTRGRDDYDRRQRRVGVQGGPADGRAEDHTRVRDRTRLGPRGQAARRAGQRRHAGRGQAGAQVRRARHRAVQDRAHVQRRGAHRAVPGHDHGIDGRREAPAPQGTRRHAAPGL